MDLNNFEFKIYGDKSPILHTEAEEVPTDFFKDQLGQGQFLNRMFNFLKQTGGVGLAAPQIGLGYKFFIMDVPKWGTQICINPKIITISEETIIVTEGCLSYPGLRLSLRRPEVVEVEYHDHRGHLIKTTLRDYPARVFQHELDHVNGVVFSDLVSSMKLNIAKRKVKANVKKIKKAGRLPRMA